MGEASVRNFTLNFGPQHPSAHGVLGRCRRHNRFARHRFRRDRPVNRIIRSLRTDDTATPTGLIDPRSGRPIGSDGQFFGDIRNELEDRGFLVASADNLITWARTGSLMSMTFGLACFTIEMMQMAMPSASGLPRARRRGRLT